MDTALSSVNLSNILKELLPVAAKWYNLGLILMFEPHELDAIKTSHSHQVEDCLREMLNRWLSRHSPDSPSPTRRLLVDALKEDTVNNPRLAIQIEDKYRNPPDHPDPVCNETGSSGSVSDVKSSIDVQSQQQIITAEPKLQHEQKGVQTGQYQPSIACVVSEKPVKRGRDESTDPDLPKPKKQPPLSVKFDHERYEFVEAVPQDLLCQKCGQLASDPHQMKCCHTLYCKHCLPVRPRNKRFQECSRGNHKQYENFQDGRSKKQVQRLKIMCVNNGVGCEWQGELCKIKEHQTKCYKEKVPCSYREIGCRVMVFRDSTKEHDVQHREKHLDYAMKTIVTVKKANSDLQQQLSTLKTIIGKNQQEFKLEIARCQYPPVTLPIHDPNFKSNLHWFQVPVHQRGFSLPQLETFEYLIRLVTVEKPVYLPPTREGTATIVIMREGGVEGEILSFPIEINRITPETSLSTMLVPWIDVRARTWHEIPDNVFPFSFIFHYDNALKRKVAVENFQDLYFRVDKIVFC